jgi:hypothetical protein
MFYCHDCSFSTVRANKRFWLNLRKNLSLYFLLIQSLGQMQHLSPHVSSNRF